MTDPAPPSPQFGAIPDLNQVASSLARQSCAAVPMAESGLDEKGIKLPMADIVATGFQHGKVFHYADTNHHNPLVTKPAAHPLTLEAIRDNGGTDIKVEVPAKYQPLVDSYNGREIDRETFQDRITDGIPLKGNDTGEKSRQIGSMAEFSRTNGIKFAFADPGNGEDDHQDRFRDVDLAADINAAKGKVFLEYGHAHFSSAEERARIEGGLVKMDVYQNRTMYDLSISNMAKDNTNGFKLNEAKPDLVYFQDSKTLHMTCATPPALRADLEKSAAELAGPSAPASEPIIKTRSQDLVTP